MVERMNYLLLTKLNELGEDAEYYCQFQELKADPIDLIIYKIVNETMGNWRLRRMTSNEQHIHILQAWFRVIEMTRDEHCIIPSKETISLRFYKSFCKYTKGMNHEEISMVLYRFPWHLQMIANTSKQNKFNREFIRSASKLKELSKFSVKKSSAHIREIDRFALDCIADDVRLDHEEKLSFAVKQNLPTLFTALSVIDEIIAGHRQSIQENDRHTYNIILYLYENAIQDEQKKNNLYTYLILAIAKICYWHVELTLVYQNWEIKDNKKQKEPA